MVPREPGLRWRPRATVGVELGIPNLRAWDLTAFPYLVFYVVHAETVEVVRVLHARRDVGARIQE